MMAPLLVKSVDIDLIIIFIVYFLAVNESSPGLFAFCQGFFLDVFSGGVPGLFTLLYLLVYFAIRIASHPIDLLSPMGRATVVFIAVIVKELLIIMLLNIFSPNYYFKGETLFYFFLSAVLTGILSVFIFYYLKISPAIDSQAEGDL